MQEISLDKPAVSGTLSESIRPNPFGTVESEVDGQALSATIAEQAKRAAKSQLVQDTYNVNTNKLRKAVIDIVKSHRPDLVNKSDNRLNETIEKRIMEGIYVFQDTLLTQLKVSESLTFTRKMVPNFNREIVELVTTARGKSFLDYKVQLNGINIAISEAKTKLGAMMISPSTNADKEARLRDRIGKLEDVKSNITIELEKQAQVRPV